MVKAQEETWLGFNQALLEENTEDSFTKVAIYQGIALATWEADGGAMPLEEALGQGIITQEEIAFLGNNLYYCIRNDKRSTKKDKNTLKTAAKEVIHMEKNRHTIRKGIAMAGGI